MLKINVGKKKGRRILLHLKKKEEEERKLLNRRLDPGQGNRKIKKQQIKKQDNKWLFH